jgi:hypothetical protein
MSEPLIVVVGASAGGLQPLTELVSNLDDGFNAAIFIVVHTKTEANSLLAEILSRSAPVPVVFAEHGARIKRGSIVVAPPDHHLLVMKSRIILNTGPKENGFRPAVDPLFRTAARAHGAAVMGVILSGALDDGSYGLRLVKEHGGLAVVQDPNEATHPGMPLSAMRVVSADHVLRAADIGRLISQSRSTAVQGGAEMARREEPEPQDPATSTRATLSTPNNRKWSRARYGVPCACSRSAPICAAGWRSAPKSAAWIWSRPDSRKAHASPRPKPVQYGRCCSAVRHRKPSPYGSNPTARRPRARRGDGGDNENLDAQEEDRRPPAT